MAFNAEKFERSKFEARRAKVPVPALSDFFDEGETPEWEVRGLSAVELHKAMEARKRQRINRGDRPKPSLPTRIRLARFARRLELTRTRRARLPSVWRCFVMGSVRHVLELPVAVKLAEAFPIEFLQLTNEISDLTGSRAELVKPQAASQPTTV